MTASSNWQPQLPLELAFVELLPEQPLPVVAVPACRSTNGRSARTLRSRCPACRQTGCPAAVVKQPVVEVEEDGETAVLPAPDPSPPLPGPSQGPMAIHAGSSRPSKQKFAPAAQHEQTVGVEGQTIILGFDYPIFKEKFTNTDGAAQAIGEAFSNLLGTHCTFAPLSPANTACPYPMKRWPALADELGGVVRERNNKIGSLGIQGDDKP
jgi:hypothetical protein